MRRGPYCIVAALGAWLGACAPSVDVEHEQRRLLETDQAFAETAFTDGAPEAFRQYLAEDALELANGDLPLHGRDAIYAAMLADANPELDLTWSPEAAVVARSGELGYTWGIYWNSWADEEGNPVAAEGKYLMVWRKAPDGRWQVVVDMNNENP
jgi:ketosteroid isomerase-like protein